MSKMSKLTENTTELARIAQELGEENLEMLLNVAKNAKGKNLASIVAMIQDGEIDCGFDISQIGKTSSLYGKKVLGELWNPYLFPIHVGKQFKKLVLERYEEKGDLNVNDAIRVRYSRNYQMDYVVNKVLPKMALMEERDPIGFAENKELFSLDVCKELIIEELKWCINKITSMLEPDYYTIKDIDREITLKIFNNYFMVGKVIETIENHKVVVMLKGNENVTMLLSVISLLINKVEISKTYGELLEYCSDFVTRREGSKKTYVYSNLVGNHNNDSVPTQLFIETFKKRGAYYTLKNAIAFEGLEIIRHDTGEVIRDIEASNYLRELLNEGKEGFWFYRIFKNVFHVEHQLDSRARIIGATVHLHI